MSANSALSGHGEIAYGNALGSIICNTALIAALTVAVKPAGVDKKTLKIPVAFFFGAMAIYGFGAYVRGSFERPLGIALLCVCAAYLFILVRQALGQMKTAGNGSDNINIKENDPDGKDDRNKEKPMWKDILLRA